MHDDEMIREIAIQLSRWKGNEPNLITEQLINEARKIRVRFVDCGWLQPSVATKLRRDLVDCRSALLDAVVSFGIDDTTGWHAKYASVVQAALDSESAHNNVDDGDLFGRGPKQE